MTWTDMHANILGEAFKSVLGRPEPGTMAFVRCLTPDVVEDLSSDTTSFFVPGWKALRVADSTDASTRTITADQAVEMREAKGEATLLLVDTARAGAGMDGIYSAAREINEETLFEEALRLARENITKRLTRNYRQYAERAVKKARTRSRRFSVSPWMEFDFLIRVSADRKHPGELLYLMGLWPVHEPDESEETAGLDVSRMFVERLLETTVSGLIPARRIDSLNLLNPSEQQVSDLKRFLRSASTKPLLIAIAELASQRHLWINELKIERASEFIQRIALVPWRTNADKIVKWSGLIEEGDSPEPPVLILKPIASTAGHYPKLEVRWNTWPEHLKKKAVEYRVAIVTDMEEEITSKEIPHSAKKEEKCYFSNDDFTTLSEDALISAKVVVSVIGNDSVEQQESEEFIIRSGDPPEREESGGGKRVRTFSEGLIELEDREIVSALAFAKDSRGVDSKGFLLLRTQQRRKSFKVFRPPLIDEVEKQWIEQGGGIGRWRVKVRASGARAGIAEFVPFSCPSSSPGTDGKPVWDRAENASRRLAELFANSGGGVGLVYDEEAKSFDAVVKEYLLAWASLLEESEPSLALVNTVEVQSLSGRTIGLIVLPNHPLRVAWHVAYDNLVLHTRFDQDGDPKKICKEMASLDSAMYPVFLPGLDDEGSFVFADTLGFHAVGMIPDYDKEPKAAIALLARALGESETSDTVPTVGKQSAQFLGKEIIKYLECHSTLRFLHIHALRPGDGMTVARSLGRVLESARSQTDQQDSEDEELQNAPAFVMEIYPSKEQKGVAGRFIAEAREKRRSGAGTISKEDSWMLESLSLPGGINLPRLRWARKGDRNPETAAHLAVAFDTFDSRVVGEQIEEIATSRPLYAFGLLSFFERNYLNHPSPLWQSCIPFSSEGEKHPSDRSHTDRLARLQQGIQKCVIRSLRSKGEQPPVLRTEISEEKAESLRNLHRLCDWVITLDRNAGIEYFDSPKTNREIYDAYVIDCVPEREDLGCLQLITSTSNLEEVRNLLDAALDQMGLSRSRRNAEFLMEHLKALSGRLAIRLTGQKAPQSELIALALSHANCCRGDSKATDCWLSLNDGFLVPVDDISDLLPPLMTSEKRNPQDEKDQKRNRPDLIHVSMLPRKGLLFRFIEVKYRRHLRAARNAAELEKIRGQVESLRSRWADWYMNDQVCASFRAVRRATLARVLRFYADKAYRHYLPEKPYSALVSEIDRMVEKGGDYAFAEIQKGDRGWVFCPEYSGAMPLEISPPEWETRIFLFGPGLLPNLESIREIDLPPVVNRTRATEKPPRIEDDGANKEKSTATTPIEDQIADPKREEGGSIEEIENSTGRTPSICFGTDILTGTEVHWPLSVEGNPHLLVAGLPGMGKTTCLLYLCRQMLEVGIRPIIFSFHQDIDQKLEHLVDSVRFIDFQGLGFNPLQVINLEARTAYLDVAGALRDIFVAIFPELGDIQGERIRKSIKESFIEAGWDDPNTSIEKLHEPEFKRFVEILRTDPKPDKGLRTLLLRLDELQDYGFFELGETRESLWESKQPIVIRIHATQNANLQKAFASLVFYGLYKDMFRRGTQNRITHAVVFDEAHRAAGLKLIPTMAKECRKYGISLVLASQEAKDFNISLFSAIANYLVLRLTEADAKALVRNVASSDQERTLMDKIKQMDRFRALYFCEGRKKPSLLKLAL
ncbi:ATP-binding protein [bacterium]|nr:ATP-binding protein [bacterium]